MRRSKVGHLSFELARIALICSEYVQKYASKENVDDGAGDSNDSDEMSSVGSYDEDEEDFTKGTPFVHVRRAYASTCFA